MNPPVHSLLRSWHPPSTGKSRTVGALLIAGDACTGAGWFLRGTVRTQRLPLSDPPWLTSSPSHFRNGHCDFGVHELPATYGSGGKGVTLTFHTVARAYPSCGKLLR